MQYTINQLYYKVIQKVLDVYAVFKNFYGEEYTDLLIDKNHITDLIKYHITEQAIPNSVDKETQDIIYEFSEETLNRYLENLSNMQAIIYVWWPQVTVTNENNKSVNIQDLYAQIKVQFDGRIPYEYIGFSLNRATYPAKQFSSNYLHSHIRKIPKDNFLRFGPPCLGSGPIRDTITTLKNESDEALWMLFCQELSMYVTVESLEGIPWKYLEKIGIKDLLYQYPGYNLDNSTSSFIHLFPPYKLKEFIKYYIKNGHLSFNYIDQRFNCALSYTNYIIDVSNAFIDFLNENLAPNFSSQRYFNNGLLYKAIESNNKFYKSIDNSANNDFSQYQNKFVLMFKGKEIRTKILEDNTEITENNLIILNHNVAMFILHSILKVINYKYKNLHNGNTEQTTSTDNTSATTYKRTLYL